MIIGGSKKKVVANIKNAADNGRLNDKVEIGDPELGNTRRKKLLGKYVKQRNEIPYHYRNWLARRRNNGPCSAKVRTRDIPLGKKKAVVAVQCCSCRKKRLHFGKCR